jgi:hypothetical protein
MKKYVIHILVGLTISFLILTIPAAIDKPREIGFLLFVATFFYGVLFKYPLIVLAILAFLLKNIEVKLNPYVISTSLVIFTIAISFLGYLMMPDLISEALDGSTRRIWIITILCCTISMLAIHRKSKSYPFG